MLEPRVSSATAEGVTRQTTVDQGKGKAVRAAGLWLLAIICLLAIAALTGSSRNPPVKSDGDISLAQLTPVSRASTLQSCASRIAASTATILLLNLCSGCDCFRLNPSVRQLDKEMLGDQHEASDVRMLRFVEVSRRCKPCTSACLPPCPSIFFA